MWCSFFSFVFEKGPFCINKGQHDENNTTYCDWTFSNFIFHFLSPIIFGKRTEIPPIFSLIINHMTRKNRFLPSFIWWESFTMISFQFALHKYSNICISSRIGGAVSKMIFMISGTKNVQNCRTIWNILVGTHTYLV